MGGFSTAKAAPMRNKIIFSLVVFGAFGALLSAYVYAVPSKPLPPVFNPAPNPYADGIYANGIVESSQSNGENTNIYSEVSGSIVRIVVAEGQQVTQGAPLVEIDDSIQKATVEQQRSQAEAAQAMLEELRAQPRKENLEVARAQVEMAQATLKTAQDALDKQRNSFALAPGLIITRKTLFCHGNEQKTTVIERGSVSVRVAFVATMH
jgi:HlyD family secretion protein